MDHSHTFQGLCRYCVNFLKHPVRGLRGAGARAEEATN